MLYHEAYAEYSCILKPICSFCSGGIFVLIANKGLAKYFVDKDKSKTYTFRLTIWDPQDSMRIDYDYIRVSIGEGKNIHYRSHV